jgi:DNA-binding MarR family transcriptional regulator
MNVPDRATTVGLSETLSSSECQSAPTLDLLMLLKNLQSNIAVVAEEYGLTIMQLYTLHAIAEEHMTMGKMAQAIRCDASNVTGIIDKLVTMGLVIRQEDPNDRRIKTVELTSEGCTLLRQIINAMPGRLGYPLVSQREISELRRILLKLTDGVSKCNQK